MHIKVTKIQHIAPFERVLEALAHELIESTDDELLEAAKDLGMDPTMRGSAAFLGLRGPAIPRLSEFFDLPVGYASRFRTERAPHAVQRSRERVAGPKKRRKPTGGGGRD